MRDPRRPRNAPDPRKAIVTPLSPASGLTIAQKKELKCAFTDSTIRETCEAVQHRATMDRPFIPLISCADPRCHSLTHPMNAWRRRMFHECDTVERRLRNLLDSLQSNAGDPNWMFHGQRVWSVSREKWIPPVVHSRSLPISDEASPDPC